MDSDPWLEQGATGSLLSMDEQTCCVWWAQPTILQIPLVGAEGTSKGSRAKHTQSESWCCCFIHCFAKSILNACSGPGTEPESEIYSQVGISCPAVCS